MTTIVAVRKNGHACLAADTLSRYGSLKENADLIANCDKIVRLEGALIAPTGPASAQLILNSYFSNPENSHDLGSLQGIFETVRALQGALKEDYFLNPKEEDDDPYESIQMEMLIASSGGIFGVYPLRSIQEFTSFYAFGSGSDIALGALGVLYEQHDDAVEIATRAVEVAARFDSSTEVPVTAYKVALAGE